MNVKCSKCGISAEGNYCSNCGTLLVNEPAIKEEEKKELPVEQDRDICPLCSYGELRRFQKKVLFGLSTIEQLICDKCEGTFQKIGENYRLINGPPDNQIFQQYNNAVLSGEEWIDIAHKGLTDLKQKENDLINWLESVKNGSQMIRLHEDLPVILKKNEEGVFALNNITLVEPRAVRSGSYGGTSVRVAKGVSFRVGGFQSESNYELRAIDSGTLILTTKRLIFTGSKKNMNTDLRKILAVKPYDNGIELRRTGVKKTQYFTGIESAVITINVDGREYKENYTGLVIVSMIEGLLKEL